jgi:S1-C subfamily serine protease
MRNCQVKENEPKPLGFVEFFELANVGLTVESSDSVRVKRIEQGTKFAKAGLKMGDSIVTLDGEKVSNSESLRSLLRTKYAEGRKTLLRVDRDGRTIEIEVTCKD